MSCDVSDAESHAGSSSSHTGRGIVGEHRPAGSRPRLRAAHAAAVHAPAARPPRDDARRRDRCHRPPPRRAARADAPPIAAPCRGRRRRPGRRTHRANAAESGCRGPDTKLHAADRRRELEPRQLLHPDVRQAAALARDARQSQANPGGGSRAMPQPQLQSLHARLPLAQKLCAASDERVERLLQIRRRSRSPSRNRSARENARAARTRGAARPAAPVRYRDRAPPPGRSAARGPARGRRSNSPIRATPMARSVCSRSASQAGAGDRQLRKLSRKQPGILDERPACRRGPATAPPESRAPSALCAASCRALHARIDGRMQCRERTEQLHAALDLQQQRVGRLDADQRRESLCMQAQALQQAASMPSGRAECRKHHRIPQMLRARASGAPRRRCGRRRRDGRDGRGGRGAARSAPRRRRINPPWRRRAIACRARRCRRSARRFGEESRSTGPGRPPCTLISSRCGAASPRVSSRRNAAGEDSNRWRSGRNSTPSAPPASAASFKRRSQRSSVPFSHSSTAAHTPEPNACSAAHKASVALAGRTTSKRSSSIPCCARAGAIGFMRRRNPDQPGNLTRRLCAGDCTKAGKNS